MLCWFSGPETRHIKNKKLPTQEIVQSIGRISISARGLCRGRTCDNLRTAIRLPKLFRTGGFQHRFWRSALDIVQIRALSALREHRIRKTKPRPVPCKTDLCPDDLSIIWMTEERGWRHIMRTRNYLLLGLLAWSIGIPAALKAAPARNSRSWPARKADSKLARRSRRWAAQRCTARLSGQ